MCTGRCPLCLLGPEKGPCHIFRQLRAFVGFRNSAKRFIEPTDDFSSNLGPQNYEVCFSDQQNVVQLRVSKNTLNTLPVSDFGVCSICSVCSIHSTQSTFRQAWAKSARRPLHCTTPERMTVTMTSSIVQPGSPLGAERMWTWTWQ